MISSKFFSRLEYASSLLFIAAGILYIISGIQQLSHPSSLLSDECKATCDTLEAMLLSQRACFDENAVYFSNFTRKKGF